MLISIQYPLADARSFLENSGGRLALPHWNAPDPEVEFVRGFGGIAIRPGGGASMGGEDRHCDARWVVRFGERGLGRHWRCAFRRFYSDGRALAKFEIGIAREPAGKRMTAIAQLDAVHEKLATVSDIQLQSGVKSRSRQLPLAELAPILAGAYLKASTAHEFGEPEPWWVQPGTPAVFVVHSAEDQLVLPPGVHAVDIPADRRSVALAHWWQECRGKHRRVWFLGHESSDYELARQLRIDLARWHCEYESLRIILKQISRGVLLPLPYSRFSDRLQQYLNDTITTVKELRSKRRGAIHETSCRLVGSATAEMLAEDTRSLVADLELQLRKLDVRPNILRKVHAYASTCDETVTLAPVVQPASPNLLLFLAANPCGTDPLRLDKECADIERELRMTAAREAFAFRSKWAVTIDDMMRHLATLQPAIIHFSGHASGGNRSVSGSSGTGPYRDIKAPAEAGIYLQDEHGQRRHVSADALAQIVATTARSTRLIVLNACFSDALAEHLCGVVDCVVGMRGAIDDESARSFATAFYRALGNRSSVANAVAQATATLAAKQLSSEHLPVCRTREGMDADRIVFA